MPTILWCRPGHSRYVHAFRDTSLSLCRTWVRRPQDAVGEREPMLGEVCRECRDKARRYRPEPPARA